MNYLKQKPQKIIWYLFALLVLFTLAVLLYTSFLPHTKNVFNNEKAVLLMQDWTYFSKDGSSRVVSLPTSLDENIPGGIRISKTLPQTGNVPISIAKYCVFQKCSIYLDNKLIFQSSDPYLKNRHLDKTSGSFWVIQRLPAHSAGKKITIEITSPYQDYRRMDTPVYLGTNSAILFTILTIYFWRLLLALVMILAGLFILVFFLSSRKMISFDSSFFYLGWFLFWLGSWTFSECHLMQFVTGNSIFITILSFVALRMSVITFMQYYLIVFSVRWKRWNQFLLIALFAEALTASSLQLFQIRDFYETLTFCHILLMAVVFSVLFENTVEVLRFHNHSYPYLFLCSMILAVFSIADLTRFYFFTHYGVGNFIGIGVILTVLIVSYHELKKTRYAMGLAREANHFRHLANTDPMTGCYNRNILQEWLATFDQEDSEKKQQFAALVCDIDNLKRINDQFGHSAGDSAICQTGDLLKDMFSNAGICCRTGGDEFLCLLYHFSESDLQRSIDILQQEIHRIDLSCAYDFSVSFGYAYFSGSLDADLNHTILRADQKMYIQKHILSKNK